MSILSFLKGILSLFISNFPEFVKKLFKKISPGIKDHVQIIIDVVNNIKSFVDSPMADVLTAIIPGTIDDRIKDWLRIWIPVVLSDLGYIKNGIVTLSSDDINKGSQLRQIASNLTQRFTGMSGDQSAITSVVVYRAAA